MRPKYFSNNEYEPPLRVSQHHKSVTFHIGAPNSRDELHLGGGEVDRLIKHLQKCRRRAKKLTKREIAMLEAGD